MVKEIPTILIDSYSCQNCGKEFKSKVPQEIEVPLLPVCSQKCAFQKLYSTINNMSLDEEMILEYLKLLKITPSIENKVRKEAIYLITKKLISQYSLLKFIILGSSKMNQLNIVSHTWLKSWLIHTPRGV